MEELSFLYRVQHILLWSWFGMVWSSGCSVLSTANVVVCSCK